MPAGRPTDYSEELAIAICDRLSSGEPLSKICADKAMPGRTTVYAWRHAHPQFQNRYARAREDAGDIWAERALEAALSADPETAAANRLKFDGLRWYASKLAPKVYGDRQQLEASVNVRGGIDAPPRPATIEDAEQWLIRRRKELAELDGPPAEQPQASPRHEAPVRPSNYEPRFPSNEPTPSQQEPRYPEPRWPSTPQPPPPRTQPTAGWTAQQEADWRRREEQDEQRREIGFRMPKLPR
jgi:hypothetical protein